MKHIATIEAVLSNDETSTDQELVNYFTSELGLSTDEAIAWVLKRNQYLGAI